MLKQSAIVLPRTNKPRCTLGRDLALAAYLWIHRGSSRRFPSRARLRGSSPQATRLTSNGTPGGHCL